MEINNKILRAGIILIGFTLAICCFFVYYTKVDDPVFFKHYYEYAFPMNEDEELGSYNSQVQLSLEYITNITDRRNIAYVIFDEAPDIVFNTSTDGYVYFDSNNTSYNMGDNYGRYSIRTANLTAMINGIDQNQEDFQLSQANIYFNNGDMMEVDLGKILLYGYEYGNGYMRNFSSGSSNDGSSFSNYAIENEITLLKLESQLLDTVDPILHIKIGEQEYSAISDIRYKKGDTLEISSSLSKPINEISLFTNYDIIPRLYYKDTAGNIYSEPIYNIIHTQYYNYNIFNIFKYLTR